MVIKKVNMRDVLKKNSLFGIWNIIPSEIVVDIIATSGLDFIILDMEHGCMDYLDIHKYVQIISGTNCSSIVRIPKVDVTIIQRILDTGVQGILAPQIHNAKDAEELVKSCTYAPEGTRGFNPYTRSGDYIGNANSIYNQDKYPLIIGIIENLNAINNIDEILNVDGIDVWYLGVYDMSCALGLKGQLNHEKVLSTIKMCEEKIKNKGKIVGRMINNSSKEDVAAKEFLVLQPDTFQLKNSIQSKLYKGK